MVLKKLVPLFIVFILFTMLPFLLQAVVTKLGLDKNVLLAANLLFFILGIGTFFIQRKALQNSNPNVFIRSVMSVMMIKMFVCIIAVLVYVLAMSDVYSTSSIFASLFLYFIYLIVEVTMMLKLNNQKNA
ncbi:MAG TPA: hypothetical protein VK718_03050 [Ferruginibacter sp.]|jgi:hypothetical protein|nr:hypothetical protein [Ferruginibacter sp.]